MCSAIEVLRLKQLQFEVASQQVLQVWQPADLSQPRCPKCKGDVFPTPYHRQQKKVGYCRRCDFYFKIVPSDRLCLCPVPGQTIACHGCPNFEYFMGLVKERLSHIEALGWEELLQRQAELTCNIQNQLPS